MSHHRINRLSFNVSTNDSDLAFQLRQRLVEEWSVVLSEFESAFDSVDPGDTWIRIPKLDIPLDSISVNQTLEQLPNILRQVLNQKIAQGDFENVANHANSLDDNLPDQHQGPWSGGDNAERHEVSAYESLLHYLKQGQLPWFIERSKTSFEKLTDVIWDHLPELTIFLHQQSRYDVFFRLVQCFDQSQLLIFTQQYIGQYLRSPQTSVLVSVIEQLLSQDKYQGFTFRQRLIVASVLLRSTNNAAIQTSASMSLDDSLKLALPEWKSLVQPLSLSQADEQWSIQCAFSDVIDRQVLNTFKLSEQPVSLMNTELEHSVDYARGTTDNFVKADVGHTTSVDFAGLILLSPYIHRLFEQCQIKVQAIPHSLLEGARAAALLSYLASGDEQSKEYQLGLIKLLLGIEMDQPLLIAPGVLSSTEKNEAEQLLTSFIGHWSALKNTSVTGVRHAFLTRQGYLKALDHAWSLTIERQGHDMLLDRFPFSYSMVKLSWMQQPIHVHW